MTHYKEKWIFRGLMVFFAFTIACLYFSVVMRAFDLREVFARYILYVEAALCLPLLLYGANNYSKELLPSAKKWIKIVQIYLLFEVINTLLFSFGHSELLADGVFWLFFIGMFFLGSSEKFWSFILSYSSIIVILTMILSIVELTTMSVSYLNLRGMRDESSYVYDIQIGFEATIILLTYYTLTKQTKGTVIAMVAFAFYFMLQFFFQKRLPLFRMTTATIVLLWILSHSFSIGKMSKIIVVLIGVLILAFSFVPDEYFEATYDRFFSGGSISKTTESDNRYLIAEKAIDVTSSDPRTFLFGNGLGSYLLGKFYGKEVPVNGRMVEGIGVIEIGFATFFMRYGVVFVLLIYGYLFSLILKWKRFKGNQLAMACWLYLLIFTMMSMIGESFPYVNTPYHTLLVAASMGYLSSFNSREKNVIILLNRHSL